MTPRFPGFSSGHAACRALLAAVALALLGATAGCGSSRAVPALPAAAPPSVADRLYELSPARIRIHRLVPQAMRLLAPHWSRLREGDRDAAQATLAGTLGEASMAPLVRARLAEAAGLSPDLAAEAVRWLESPLGFDVKFSEATAWKDDERPGDDFYANVSDVKGGRAPEVRMEKIRRLAAETSALERSLDETARIGSVVARLVNVARPGARPLSEAALGLAIEQERNAPAVAAAFEPVVMAALLGRCRELDLQQVDGLIEFMSGEAGRWYAEVMAQSMLLAIGDAATGIEQRFDAAAHSDGPSPEPTGFDLDALRIALPSGGYVRLLAYTEAGPQSGPAVVLRYETMLSLSEEATVRREAGEVWSRVRPHVESAGASAAVLQATGGVTGWVFPFASSRRFAWQRRGDGAWDPVAAGPGAPAYVAREMLWSIPP